VLLDLLTGCIVVDLLRRLRLPLQWSLIYLWNPLVAVEFAHGAHMDALMICLLMAAVWALVALRSQALSVVALAASTLTKGLPVLLLPLFARRWGWRWTALYAVITVAACIPFALGAGWGLIGPLNGEGLFGAIRIYADRWDYNSGIYGALASALSYLDAQAQALRWTATGIAKAIVLIGLGLVEFAVWRARSPRRDDLALLRWMVIPVVAYLLLTTTVHPWYVTLIVPLLSFLTPGPQETARTGRWLWPWLYLAVAVAFSYLTYLDPVKRPDYGLVHVIEYVPVYLLLIWAARPGLCRP